MSSDNPKSYLKLGLLVLLLILLVLLSALVFPKPKGKTKSLISPEFFKGVNLTSTFSFIFKSEDLSKIVQKNLEGKEGEYAVYIEDLTDGENYSLRASDTFPAASLYKVFLMAAVLKEIENGKLTMDNTLSASLDHLTEVYGGLDFGYEDIPDDDVIEYSVEEALTRVGRISDNFASIMLMDKIGTDKVQSVIDSTGANSTVLKSPTLRLGEGQAPLISTSAEDIGIFFKSLYKREVVNKNISEKVIEFLSLNQLNNRIPAGVPEGVKVVHKTGELAGVRHDAGIVYIPENSEQLGKPDDQNSGLSDTSDSSVSLSPSEYSGRAYVIVLMSKDLKYEDEGVETLAKISKDVYKYFEKKNIQP